MAGEVLYRKWRPPRFTDIVGQGPITQTLINAVANERTSHAYLFCGPRGTGKTSTARVLAKALNCTMRPPGVGDPCGACNNCRAVDNGSFIDIIEVDAASNRGIDEMRDLREKVRFAPTVGRNKVYIIDEAHQLTEAAVNAFLKTLEEPPPHSVFILATTEPDKLLATITSRCQRFDFRRISPQDVAERLSEIAREEGVDASMEVMRTIARASGGSLRDATNLLDQLITSFGNHLTVEQVQELLGIGGEESALALAKHMLTGNTTEALTVINAVASEGSDLRPLHRMTLEFLRAALLMKSGVASTMDDLSKEAQSQLSFVAGSVSLEHIMRSLRVFSQASLRFDQPSPLPLELAAIELSIEPAQPAPVVAAAPQPQQAPAAAAPRPMRPQGQPVPRPAPRPVADNAPPATPPPPAVYDPSVPVDQRLASQWPVILKSLSRVARRRFDVAALLRSSSSRAIVDNTLVVRFSHQSNSERLQDELGDPRVRMEVERVLEQVLGEPITISVDADGSRQQAATNGESSGHLLRAAMNLGGQLVTNSAGVPVENASAPAPVPLVEDASVPAPAPPVAEASAPAPLPSVGGQRTSARAASAAIVPPVPPVAEASASAWRRPAHQRPRLPWRRPAHQRPCRPWRRPAHQRTRRSSRGGGQRTSTRRLCRPWRRTRRPTRPCSARSRLPKS